MKTVITALAITAASFGSAAAGDCGCWGGDGVAGYVAAPTYGYVAPAPTYGYVAPAPTYGYVAAAPAYGYAAAPYYDSYYAPSYGYRIVGYAYRPRVHYDGWRPWRW